MIDMEMALLANIAVTMQNKKVDDVLDEIKAEIYQKRHDYMLTGSYYDGVRFGLMLAYQIIDKYKAESED